MSSSLWQHVLLFHQTFQPMDQGIISTTINLLLPKRWTKVNLMTWLYLHFNYTDIFICNLRPSSLESA
jgi:hypothetical protein